MASKCISNTHYSTNNTFSQRLTSEIAAVNIMFVRELLQYLCE